MSQIRDRGFPAHAGMDRGPAARTPMCRGLPRARGDGPKVSMTGQMHPAASPRTRGWTQVAGWPTPTVRGFPAHAGMDPRQSRKRPRPCGLPRARGDGPDARQIVPVQAKASPRTRGWTPRSPVVAISCSWLPRARGDGPLRRLDPLLQTAASPRTRGWTFEVEVHDAVDGGFPAHAGMDRGPIP